MKKIFNILLIGVLLVFATACGTPTETTDYDYIKAQQSTISLEGNVSDEMLPTELNGVTITWQSNIAGTLDNNKLVQGKTDIEVELFATFTYNDTVINKIYTVTIIQDPNYNPDLETVIKVKTELSFDSTEIYNNIVLETTKDGVSISWVSSNTDIITNDGTVTRPAEGSGDALVILTATFVKGTESTTKDFEFTVKEATQTVEYIGYYEGVDGLTGEVLKQFLHDLIDDHTVRSYKSLNGYLAETDEDPNNPNNIILLYSGNSIPSTWDSGASWNKEHVWPRSHGDLEGTPAYSDMHHLRPTLPIVNSDRGNLDFDNGGSLQRLTDDCYRDSDSFEPRDEVKGDVARMVFYMAVRYEGDNGEPDLEIKDITGTSGAFLGKLSTLLQWHIDDPVDDYERNRNEVIFSYQHNRNPFIDHPELVELIWSIK